MNNKRRKEISSISSILEDAKSRLSTVIDDEQEAFDNMPESLQGSERGCESEEALDSMNDALDSIESAIEYLDIL